MNRDLAARLPPGPPWIGPLITRLDFERQFLWLHLAMLLSAMLYFGWRALVMVAAMTVTGLAVYLAVALFLRLTRRVPAASPLHALNLAMLLPLTLPISRGMGPGLAAAAVLGLLVHFVGPTHRVRVHPVALAHLLLLLGLPLPLAEPVDAVLAPGHAGVGEVLAVSDRVGGPTWLRTSVTAPGEAIRREDPGRVMRLEQREILLHETHMAALLRQTRHEGGDADRHELHRLSDVLLGAVPGPVGATGKLLLILGGIYLMHRRVSRWSVAIFALLAALVTLALVPVGEGSARVPSLMRFLDLDPRVTLSYLAYQVLASPLPLIVLVMAPLTMPRTTRGRIVYACVLGAGVVLVRWYSSHEDADYLPLVAAGLLAPLLDRLRYSPFVRGG